MAQVQGSLNGQAIVAEDSATSVPLRSVTGGPATVLADAAATIAVRRPTHNLLVAMDLAGLDGAELIDGQTYRVLETGFGLYQYDADATTAVSSPDVINGPSSVGRFVQIESGTSGQSAYDIWLGEGNTGTEQDFLDDIAGSATNGNNGLGWTGASYDTATGKATFASTDGLGFVTGDLRGADGDGWTGATYSSSTGVVTFASDDGLGFTTSDLRGAAGKGWASGSYNSSTGIVTFASADGLGFTTGDLRANDGNGWTGVTYSSTTGQLTFASDDGLDFTSPDLRGVDGSGSDYGPPDDTVSLQTQVDNISTYGFGIVKKGETEITTPIDTGNLAGGALRGYGGATGLLHATHFQRAQSNIFCGSGFDVNLAAIKLRGRAMTLEDFGIYGDDYLATGRDWQAAEAVTPYTRRLATAAEGGFSIGSSIRPATDHLASGRTTGGTFDATEAAEWTSASIPHKHDAQQQRPAAGVHVAYDAGIGSGKHTLKGLYVQGFKHGFLAGDNSEGVVNWQAATSYTAGDKVLSPSTITSSVSGKLPTGKVLYARTDHTSGGTWDASAGDNWFTSLNCDETKIHDCNVSFCDNFLTLTASQNLGWKLRGNLYYNDLRTADSGTFVNVEGGGDLSARDTTILFACTLMKLNQALEDGANVGWGPNNGQYVFDKVQVDAAACDSVGYFKAMKFVNTAYSNGIQATVKINDLQLPTTATYGTGTGVGHTFADLGDLLSLEMYGGRCPGGMQDAITWDVDVSDTATLIVEGWKFNGVTDGMDLLKLTGNTGNLNYRFSKNQDFSGNWLPDINDTFGPTGVALP